MARKRRSTSQEEAQGVALIEWSWGTYTDLFDDPRYAERLQWHADHLFHGKRGIECSDEEWAPGLFAEMEDIPVHIDERVGLQTQ
jgi:hypothetical protein